VMRIAVAATEAAPESVPQTIDLAITPVAVRAPMARRFQQSRS
jgi:hypothetical protein